MEEAAVLARRLTSKDPEVGLQAVAALRRLLDQIERLQVGAARDRGWLWKDIAGALGVTKQAVHAKHAARRRSQEREET